MLIYHPENPRALKKQGESPLPVLCEWNNKAHPFTAWFTEYFKPSIEMVDMEVLVSVYISGTEWDF